MIPLIVAVLLVAGAVIGWNLLQESESTADAAGVSDIEQTQTVDDISLTLDSISRSTTGLELNFTLALPEGVAASHQPQVLGPLFIDQQVQLENVALLPEGLSFQTKPHLAGEATLAFEMWLGDVQDPSLPVRVEFVQLRLRGDDEPFLVDGSWSFVIQPEDIPQDEVEAKFDVQQSKTQESVTATVSEVEVLDAALRVHYEVATTNGAPFSLIGQGIQLRESDGGTLLPLTVDRVDQAGDDNSGSFVATFGRSAGSQGEVTLEIGPFFVGNAQPATLTVDQPLAEASAEPVTIDGEQIGLGSVTYRKDDQQLDVTIANLESSQNAQVVFLGPAAPEVNVKDDLGQAYSVTAAGSGMHRFDDGTMRAGDSNITIAGPFEPGLQTLTITVEQSGFLQRDRLVFDVRLP